jgi:hypothetical protein
VTLSLMDEKGVTARPVPAGVTETPVPEGAGVATKDLQDTGDTHNATVTAASDKNTKRLLSINFRYLPLMD